MKLRKPRWLHSLHELVGFWKARRAAKKFNLDFEHGCCFDSQLRNYTRFPEDGRIVDVKMQSGKVALYKMILVRYLPGSTGQKHWRFEFQGYKPNV